MTYDVCQVDGPPSGYMTAVQRARDIQELSDPEYGTTTIASLCALRPPTGGFIAFVL